jgi:hypothetical protein
VGVGAGSPQATNTSNDTSITIKETTNNHLILIISPPL